MREFSFFPHIFLVFPVWVEWMGLLGLDYNSFFIYFLNAGTASKSKTNKEGDTSEREEQRINEDGDTSKSVEQTTNEDGDTFKREEHTTSNSEGKGY